MVRAIEVSRCPGVQDTYFRLGREYFKVLPSAPTKDVLREWTFSWSNVVKHVLFIDRDEAARRLWALGYSPLDR